MSPEDLMLATHPFGTTDLRASEYGLGCARIGGIFKEDPSEFANLLTTAFDAGITFFDTSNIYSQGESETLLGRVFKRRRDQVIFASKAGFVLPARRRFVAGLKPFVRPVLRTLRISRSQLPSAMRGALTQSFTPEALRGALENSLRRLRTDRLDLLQLHAPPVGVVESSSWVETLEALKREGKIRYYGVSCESPAATLAALRHTGLSSIQVTVNLLHRDELDAVALARSRGLAVIARECLANGLLVKDLQPGDVRRHVESDAEAAVKTQAIAGYTARARARGASLAQLALGYVNGLDGVSVTLIGVSRLAQLKSLLAAGLPGRTDAQRAWAGLSE